MCFSPHKLRNKQSTWRPTSVLRRLLCVISWRCISTHLSLHNLAKVTEVKAAGPPVPTSTSESRGCVTHTSGNHSPSWLARGCCGQQAAIPQATPVPGLVACHSALFQQPRVHCFYFITIGFHETYFPHAAMKLKDAYSLEGKLWST